MQNRIGSERIEKERFVTAVTMVAFAVFREAQSAAQCGTMWNGLSRFAPLALTARHCQARLNKRLGQVEETLPDGFTYT